MNLRSGTLAFATTAHRRARSLAIERQPHTRNGAVDANRIGLCAALGQVTGWPELSAPRRSIASKRCWPCQRPSISCVPCAKCCRWMSSPLACCRRQADVTHLNQDPRVMNRTSAPPQVDGAVPASTRILHTANDSKRSTPMMARPHHRDRRWRPGFTRERQMPQRDGGTSKGRWLSHGRDTGGRHGEGSRHVGLHAEPSSGLMTCSSVAPSCGWQGPHCRIA